ncbi:MAG TPA: ATP-binding protein [Phototrophicaceae bacterium]|nr:ATP-binding protein [Phototrophicaceae bacterium]
MSVPTKHDFATDVRSDRLAVLWKVTLIGCIVLIWTVAIVASLNRHAEMIWFVALAVLGVGCIITGLFLRYDRYLLAVWSYTIGGLLAGGIALANGESLALQVIPFVFPIIVFVVGLLLSAANTFLVTGLVAGIILIAPTFSATGQTQFVENRLFALGLTVVSALLAAQVTGELYKVTEWALLNYQRERRTTEDLFESRRLLQKELVRSQALSEELQLVNQQLETARAAAEEAKHFRGQFLANMSHELRTPLNAIIGFSETMLVFPTMYNDVPLPPAYEHDLKYIFESGKQLLNLINDILDLSKVDAGKLDIRLEPIELTPIIEGVLSTAAGLIGNKPVKLHQDLPTPLPSVLADANRVRQVLTNLYSNAVKFTDSGSITLTVRQVDAMVQFSVKDTGPGIDPQFHETIFEEFKQAEVVGRDPRSGAGLGLAIARQLLTLMQGRIWVESEVGKGSTFHILLPVDTSHPEAEATRPVAALQL